MVERVSPGVIAYICCHCVPEGSRLPRQWRCRGEHVAVRSVPCSGKIDAQYLLHAFEGGAKGLCVVTCPKGECTLAQGNYRAEIRTRTIQRLLAEIGIEPERIELLLCSPNDPADQFERVVREAVERLCALGAQPTRVESQHDTKRADRTAAAN